MEQSFPNKTRRNQDVQCLRCGVFNIPENKICGRCGANLPLVYDEEGNVFQLKDRRGTSMLGRSTFAGARFSPSNTAWVLRFCVILFALLMALWILHHR